MNAAEALDRNDDVIGLGALRFITPAKVKAAAQLVLRGQVIALNLPLEWPPPAQRPALRRTVLSHHASRPLPNGREGIVNDDAIEIGLQSSSHWDSLAHFGLLEPDGAAAYYGDLPLSETRDSCAPTLGIHNASGGIATRGILLDMVAYFGRTNEGWLEGSTRVTSADVLGVLEQTGLQLERGDAVLLHTGFPKRFLDEGSRYPAVMAGTDASTNQVWIDKGVAAVISDNLGIEALPSHYETHIEAARRHGIYLGELWKLDELAEACRQDQNYQFLLVSVPLSIFGAFGSPANAVAIR